MAFDKWTEMREYVNAIGTTPETPHVVYELLETLRMKMIALEHEEARLKPPEPTLRKGDKVRHKKNGTVGSVEGFSASGKSLWFKPAAWRGLMMYPASSFELVEEAPQ